MRVECAGSFLVEDVWKVVVFFRDGAEVDGCIGDRGAGLCSHLRDGKLEDFSAIHPADASECGRADEGNFQCFKLWSYFTGIRDRCCQWRPARAKMLVMSSAHAELFQTRYCPIPNQSTDCSR